MYDAFCHFSACLNDTRGNLLIQFHIGNLSYELTQKSQKIFAETVMPRLQADSEKLFGERFPIEIVDNVAG